MVFKVEEWCNDNPILGAKKIGNALGFKVIGGAEIGDWWGCREAAYDGQIIAAAFTEHVIAQENCQPRR